MLTALMKEQQQRLVKEIQDPSHYVSPEVVSALALIDILDILGDIRSPEVGDSQDS